MYVSDDNRAQQWYVSIWAMYQCSPSQVNYYYYLSSYFEWFWVCCVRFVFVLHSFLFVTTHIIFHLILSFIGNCIVSPESCICICIPCILEGVHNWRFCSVLFTMFRTRMCIGLGRVNVWAQLVFCTFSICCARIQQSIWSHIWMCVYLSLRRCDCTLSCIRSKFTYLMMIKSHTKILREFKRKRIFASSKIVVLQFYSVFFLPTASHQRRLCTPYECGSEFNAQFLLLKNINLTPYNTLFT